MLPKNLTSRLQSILGEDFSSVMSAFSMTRIGSFRINVLKCTENVVLEEFASKNILVEKYEGISGVYIFDRQYEYAIKGTRAFYDGKIYLQSIASMLPVLALNPKNWESVLDVCAAPGSKTTQMAMMMWNQGNITAIEQNQIRYDKLIHNARLQGATNITGIKMDAKKYLDGSLDLFDAILLDAPCSAEGRINLNNEKSYGFWSIENIRNKAELQYELLSLSWRHLRKWGVLVYSTCTLAPEENEGVFSRFLLGNSDATFMNIDLGLSVKSWWKSGMTSFQNIQYGEEMKKTVRILPSWETEGFFVVKIKKEG